MWTPCLIAPGIPIKCTHDDGPLKVKRCWVVENIVNCNWMEYIKCSMMFNGSNLESFEEHYVHFFLHKMFIFLKAGVWWSLIQYWSIVEVFGDLG